MDIVKSNPSVRQVVYVQMRQAVRGKDGRLRITKTKTRTLHNATIEEVERVLEKGGHNETVLEKRKDRED